MADQINLALSHFQKGDFVSSLSILENVRLNKPKNAFAWFLSGVIYMQTNNVEMAIDAFRASLKIQPNHPEAHNNLGVALEAIENYHEATTCYKMAIAQRKNYANAYYNLANLQKNEADFNNAKNNYLLAIKHNPKYSNALNNLALLYQHDGNYSKSEDLLTKAIKLSPNDLEMKNNLGFNDYCQFKYNKSLNLFQKILKVSPNYAPTILNMGLLMQAMNNINNARKYFIEASHDNLHHIRAMNNLAYLELSNSNFEKGWQYYQYRPSIRDIAFKTIETLSDNVQTKSILLYKDQGLGDEIFFSRYIPLLNRCNTNISYFTDKRLKSFWERKFKKLHILTTKPTFHDFDCVISMGDLPRLFFQNGDVEIPVSLQLSPKSDILEKIKNILPNNGKPNLAITWEAGVRGKNTLFKKIPTDILGKKLSSIDANILVIQRNPRIKEVKNLEENLKRKTFNYAFLNDNLEEMLAFLSLIDEYVCVSNTNTHIMALLGKTSHVLVPHPPEWRWMNKRDRSPWFPLTHLYRQSVDGKWDFTLQFQSYKKTHNI